jgi:uncharacterized protein YjbI with pentapeptide repeats
MKRSHWSIADLDRQQLVVGGLALRAELDRRELHAARLSLVRNIRATVGAPLALSGCFFAGVALSRAVAPLGNSAVSGGRRLGWSVFAAKALQALALSRATAP